MKKGGTLNRARAPRRFGAERSAFTLIELLVVICVILVLLGILGAVLSRVRESGRGSVCAATLHHAGLATAMYLDDNDGAFWPYHQDVPHPGGGRRWWFGFEPNGPSPNAWQRNRPLDKSAGFVGRYLSASAVDLMCPSFPYSGKYFPKFSPPAGGYGYNTAALGGFNLLNPTARTTRRVSEFVGRTADVFVLADGIHFDRMTATGPAAFEQTFNEPPYIQWQDPARFGTNAGVNGGFGHFRHSGRATVLYLDGHAASQPPRRPRHPFSSMGYGPVTNLTDDALRVRQIPHGAGSLSVDAVYGLN